MKRLLISLLIFSLSVFLCFCCYAYIEQQAFMLTDHLNNTGIAIDNNDIPSADENIYKSIRFWDKIEPVYRILIDGEICNELDTEINSIQFCLTEESYSDAKLHINNCRIILRQITEAEQLSAEAIL